MDEAIESWEVLDLMTSLVDKSLVIYDEQAGEGRYRLLETVRQYSRDRLAESAEVQRLRERHRDWFLGLALQAEPEIWADASWLDRLEREHDNLRAALDWTGAQGQAELGLRLGWALWWFWCVRGYLAEGREYLARMLALPGAEARTPLRAWVLGRAGLLTRNLGEYGAARALYAESLAINRELGDKENIAWALIGLGLVARDQGEYETARALLEESLALFRELGHKGGSPSLSTAWVGRPRCKETTVQRAHSWRRAWRSPESWGSGTISPGRSTAWQA